MISQEPSPEKTQHERKGITRNGTKGGSTKKKRSTGGIQKRNEKNENDLKSNRGETFKEKVHLQGKT